MSTMLDAGITTELNPPPVLGTKTLCVKNVPHAVWQRARQNALASNLSFGDYIVKLLSTAGPFPPAPRSVWDTLLGSVSPLTTETAEPSGTHRIGLTSTEAVEGSGPTPALAAGRGYSASPPRPDSRNSP